ncbi:MAG: hypothetical protein G01um101472_620, partial [Parcubacteria group bacterium Gr01-1014_72]
RQGNPPRYTSHTPRAAYAPPAQGVPSASVRSERGDLGKEEHAAPRREIRTAGPSKEPHSMPLSAQAPSETPRPAKVPDKKEADRPKHTEELRSALAALLAASGGGVPGTAATAATAARKEKESAPSGEKRDATAAESLKQKSALPNKPDKGAGSGAYPPPAPPEVPEAVLRSVLSVPEDRRRA